MIASRFDLLEDQLATGRFELVHLTVFYLNVLQHFYWDMDAVKRAWKLIDERVADLLTMDELDNLVVMSDHGSNEITMTFRANTWLEQEGYLTTKSSVSDYLHRAGITEERVRPILARLGIEWWARRLLPERIQRFLPDEEGSVGKSAKADVIDWERSRAVASGQGPLYVLADSKRERERIATELKRELERVRSPSGRPVFDQVRDGSAVYDGAYADQGPDLVLDQAAGVHIEGKIGNDSVFGEPTKWHGENKDTGMFIAYGEDFATEADLDDMHILDIAPTVLHLHDTPVLERMDGSVRREIFAEESSASARDVQYQTRLTDRQSDGREADRDVTDRLSDLGYME
jgi:predicted AlkP superfamily phosphohydrolase/phosphomutase